ncbi:hypothetical protein [Nocardia puris]|uniref:hypothetical protein n=1 Tax=Nocardia puris TaxID=208602 RepID=UPI002E1A41BC
MDRLDRADRNVGHHTLDSLAGPEFTSPWAVYAPLRALPLGVQAVVMGLLLAVAMVGCSVAWVDYQDYVPSPNVCRSADAGVPAERPGSCVPREQLPQEVR